MWSLLLDLVASIATEWRLWKWIHDPPLKGDRPREPENKKHKEDKQHPLVKAVIVVFLFVAIVFAAAFLIMLGQGIYWAATKGV